MMKHTTRDYFFLSAFYIYISIDAKITAEFNDPKADSKNIVMT